MKRIIFSILVALIAVAKLADCGQVIDSRQIRASGLVLPILVSRLEPDILPLDIAVISNGPSADGFIINRIPVFLSVETNNPPITIEFSTDTPNGNLYSGERDFLPTYYAIAPIGSPAPMSIEARRRWISGSSLSQYQEHIQTRKYERNIYVKVSLPGGIQPGGRKKKYSTRVRATIKDKNSTNINIVEFTAWTEVVK